MPMLNLPQSVLDERIREAKSFSDAIKQYSTTFGLKADRLIRSCIHNIHLALLRGEPIGGLLDELFLDLEQMLLDCLDYTFNLACERENADTSRWLYLFPLLDSRCSLSFYQDAIGKYRNIIEQEIEFAQRSGFSRSMETFLLNPQGYISKKKDGLLRLKEGVSEVNKGVSYSLMDNIKKIGITALTVSGLAAMYHLWQDRGVVAYYGIRNSNYPCSLCDDYARRIIPMSEGMVYPLHNRCVCSVVYVNQNELEAL